MKFNHILWASVFAVSSIGFAMEGEFQEGNDTQFCGELTSSSSNVAEIDQQEQQPSRCISVRSNNQKAFDVETDNGTIIWVPQGYEELLQQHGITVVEKKLKEEENGDDNIVDLDKGWQQVQLPEGWFMQERTYTKGTMRDIRRPSTHSVKGRDHGRTVATVTHHQLGNKSARAGQDEAVIRFKHKGKVVSHIGDRVQESK